MTATTSNAPMTHNRIENSVSRLWKKAYLNTVVKQCKEAGYDCVVSNETICIGLAETDQVFLKALKGNGVWLTRYDQKLFDENFGS
jgi:hypothetical protein